jgi:hypothetical protein
MVDSFAMIIATNVAVKITNTLTGHAQQAVAAIVSKVREKLRSRPGESSEVATLDAAITGSEASATEVLAQVLGELFAKDPQFHEEIRTLWESAGSDDRVTNVFSGQAGKVVMMRDVNGDLTIT